MNGLRIRLALFGLVFGVQAVAVSQLQAVDFAHDVVPVLQRNCVHCHGGREAEGDFSLNTRESVVDSGYVDLDDLAYSHLIEVVTSNDPDTRMPPPERPPMNEQEVLVLRRWIEAGLPWDDGFTFSIDSYEPSLRPRSPELPPARDGRSNPIDRILDQYLSDKGLVRPEPIDDAAFLRRVSLDLVGLLPTDEQLNEFVSNPSPTKRDQVIDSLLADEIGYAEHWITFFNDLLRNDYSGTGFITGGRKQISNWLYDSLLQNKPFNQMASELIAPLNEDSQGYIDGIKWRGEVSAGQTIPIQFSQSVSQSFLGINMKCASCHDSFIDRWTLKDAYGLAAIYANESLELHRCDKPTGETAQAQWMFPELGQVDANSPREKRLQQLAALMTHPENGRFARTIVNRLWYQLMGRGIVHPLDAMQSKPWNEDLLDYLAVDFVENDFDLKAMLRRIATSAAYQSRTEVMGEKAAGDQYIYRGPRAKRMTAEQFIDGIWQLTSSAPDQYDAPVIRGIADSNADNSTQLEGVWIWGPNNNGVAPGEDTIVLRKQFDLDSPIVSGGAMITCDNEFDLYVNEKWVSSGDDWSRPQSVILTKHLQQGTNTLHVIAKNGLDKPNAAGLYLEARLILTSGPELAVQSDASWQYNTNAPKPNKRKLGSIQGEWLGAIVVPELSVWRKVVDTKIRPVIARIKSGGKMPMVRASLLKNTALMKSLGRPMREQIVSMRPDTLTTLEAIDLANEPQLAGAFAAGAKRLLKLHGDDLDGLIEALFASALARNATPAEYEIMRSALGDQPDTASVQDAMWAVCMLPEFILIR
ncbi:MAG: DUF1549 domain-containing protein [Pirellulaceae bacterium]